MKRMVILLRIAVMVFVLIACSEVCLFAAVNEGHDVLIRNFAVALKNDDQKEIKNVLKTFEDNDQAVSYMEKNFPKVYASYRWQHILGRIYDLKARYGQKEEYIPVSFAGKTGIKRTLTNNRAKSNSRNKYSNETTTKRYSNSTRLRQNRTTIGEIAHRSPNQVRSPNNTRSVRRSR